MTFPLGGGQVPFRIKRLQITLSRNYTAVTLETA